MLKQLLLWFKSYDPTWSSQTIKLDSGVVLLVRSDGYVVDTLESMDAYHKAGYRNFTTFKAIGE